MTESRKLELLEKIKYVPSSKRPRSIYVFIRSFPFLYSLFLRFKKLISVNKYTQEGKKKFIENKELFVLNKQESEYFNELRENGIVVIEDYFDSDLLSKIKTKSDLMFRNLDIDKNAGYNVALNRLSSLKNLSYDEISTIEVFVSLKDPLINIKDLFNITFNESLLKIMSNYLGYIPSHRSSIARFFPKNPPVEPSYFHKDDRNVEVFNIFIYLDDVDEDGGPFCYIPKSHNNSIQSCKPRRSEDMNKNDSYGRISDEEMKKYYPKESWKVVTGKKGTVIIADTNGLHKGPMWNNKPIEEQHTRDIIQIHARSLSLHTRNDIYGNIPKDTIDSFSGLQKLFLSHYEVV